MHIPSHFRQDDPKILFDFIEQHSFGLLVSRLDGELYASHLPLLVDREAEPHGRLIGHQARANPQWTIGEGPVLAVFSGPHAYISPAWYEAEEVVPTWNYLAVHVYGTLRLVHEPEAVREILRRYVETYEGPRQQPWTFDVNAPFVEKLSRGIVAFHVDIERIEGKWKLNQNHPPERRERVIRALDGQGDEKSRAIADWMRAELEQE